MSIIKSKQVDVNADFDFKSHKLINLSTPLSNTDAATKLYVDQRNVKSGGTITGDLLLLGNLYVSGITTTIDVGNLNIRDNIVILNSGETSDHVTLQYAGIEINRGTGTSYRMVFNDTAGDFQVGLVGSLQSVATREDTPNSSGVSYWNSTFKRLDTSSKFKYNGTDLYLSGMTQSGTSYVVYYDLTNGRLTYEAKPTGGVTDHNTLTNIQGGTTAQYYHLTQTDYLNVTGLTSIISNSVSVEASLRTSADVSLSTAVSTQSSQGISVEASLRTSADVSLDTKISTSVSTEASLRTSADVSLDTKISTSVSTEASLRTSADVSLASAVSTQTSQRVSVEASLRTSADASLDTKISTSVSTEASLRTSADSSLASAISSGSTNSLQPWIDINRNGFVDNTQTSISFNDTTYVFTLSGITNWSYYRAGIKYTVTGNRTVTLPSTAGTYYITINSTNGTLISGTTVWTLEDAVLPVAVIRLNTSLTPKYHMAEERHTIAIDRKMHKYLHETRGTQFISGGGLTGPAVRSAVNADNCFGISEAIIADEDLYQTLSGLTRPDGATPIYNIFYRYNSTGWTWQPSDVPFKYNGTGYIEYDVDGVMTSGVSANWYNTYLLFTDLNSSGRFSIVQGRGNFTSLALAQAENPLYFDWTGFPVAESIISYQFSWRTNSAYTSKGKCRLDVVPKRINISTTSTVGSGAGTDHNTLSGLQGGTTGEMYHLTNADYLNVTGLTSIISNSVSVEASLRTSADASLTTAVSTTTSQRISADASLATVLNTKLNLSGGTLSGVLSGTTLYMSGLVSNAGKVYMSGILNNNSADILYYNSTTKEVSYYSPAGLSVSSAGYTFSLYESDTDSYVTSSWDGVNSNIWLQSDIGYAVSVDYATSSNNAANLNGVPASSYALKSQVLALSGGTLTGGITGTTIYTSSTITGLNIRPNTPITLSASSPVWNMNLSCVATLTLTASTSLSITNVVSGDTGTLRVIQGNGSYTLTMPTGTKKTSTITISTTNGAVDILSFVYIGGSYYFNQGKNYT